MDIHQCQRILLMGMRWSVCVSGLAEMKGDGSSSVVAFAGEGAVGDEF
jgi:hypothetical protein